EKDDWRIYLHTDPTTTCPFSPDHPANTFYVMQGPNGALKAGCHHNRCGGRDQHWQEFRAMYDPPGARTKATAASAPNPCEPQDTDPIEQARTQIAALLNEAKTTKDGARV